MKLEARCSNLHPRPGPAAETCVAGDVNAGGGGLGGSSCPRPRVQGRVQEARARGLRIAELKFEKCAIHHGALKQVHEQDHARSLTKLRREGLWRQGKEGVIDCKRGQAVEEADLEEGETETAPILDLSMARSEDWSTLPVRRRDATMEISQRRGAWRHAERCEASRKASVWAPAKQARLLGAQRASLCDCFSVSASICATRKRLFQKSSKTRKNHDGKERGKAGSEFASYHMIAGNREKKIERT